MKEFYKNLDEIKFKKLSILGLLVADLISFVIFHGRITSDKMLSFMVEILRQGNKIPRGYSGLEILKEISPLIKNFSFMLFSLLFVYHLVIYLFYVRGSKKCLAYIRFYSGTAMLGALAIGVSMLLQGSLYGIAILFASILFAFFSLAPKELRKIKTGE